MSVSLALVVFFGLAVVMMLRTKSIGSGAAVLAILFGFYLSATGAAAPINHAVVAVFGDLSHLH